MLDDEASTCPLLSRTTGGPCGGTLFDRKQRAHELSLLKAQLRLAAARA
jgi:hypothetical protein